MVLVVVLLQFVEPSSLAVGGIDVVQGVVHEVIAKITDSEGDPEKGKYYRVADWNYLYCQRKQKVQLNHHQNRRVHQSLSE